MKWVRNPQIGGSLDETSVEWEEHWTVQDFRPDSPETAWIGLLEDRPEFRHGQPHTNPAVRARVVNFDWERLGTTRDAWDVAVRYRREAEEREENPLERPAEIDLDAESEIVPVDRDADGKPILSSAGGLIAGLTEEEPRWIFNVSKNVVALPPWLLSYRNAANIDAVRIGGITISPGYLLLKNPRAGKPQRVVVRGIEIEYRELTFSLVYNPKTWITRIYDRDLYELAEVEVQVPDPDGERDTEGNLPLVSRTAIQRVRMTTKNEQGEDVEVDEPQFLDGSGRRPRNSDGTVKAPLTPEDIHTIERWTKHRLPFRNLPLT